MQKNPFTVAAVKFLNRTSKATNFMAVYIFACFIHLKNVAQFFETGL